CSTASMYAVYRRSSTCTAAPCCSAVTRSYHFCCIRLSAYSSSLAITPRFSGSLLPRLPVLSRQLLDQLLRAQITDGRDLLRLGLAQAFIHFTDARQLLLSGNRVSIILIRSCLPHIPICGIAIANRPV